jgi:hypothetical protein
MIPTPADGPQKIPYSSPEGIPTSTATVFYGKSNQNYKEAQYMENTKPNNLFSIDFCCFAIHF